MGASASCIYNADGIIYTIPTYSQIEVKNTFPVVNDEKTFSDYIAYAKKNNHMQQIHKHMKINNFIEMEDELPCFAKDILTTGTKPFNVFARLASSEMENTVDQSILKQYSNEWMVCHNKPENDKDWNDVSNTSVSMCGPDATGPGHVFITTQDLDWTLFNITTIVLTKNVKFLLKLKEVATYYAKQRGWKKAGFYFHCFPHNSVNSLHLHVCNEDEQFIGHMHKQFQYKNLSLDVAIAVAQFKN
jgi:hypothetical protein